jgi:hypothetical protein
MKNLQKSLTPIVILMIAVLVVGGGAYLVLRNQQPKQKNATQNTSNVTPTEQAKSWKTYRSEKHGFEFQYPTNGYTLDDKLVVESAGFNTVVSVHVSPRPIEFGQNFSVGVKNVEPGTNLVQFAKTLFGNNFISSESITVNGVNWLKVRTLDSYFEKEVSTNYFALQGSKLYRVYYFQIGSSAESDFVKIFSSIKFIPISTN